MTLDPANSYHFTVFDGAGRASAKLPDVSVVYIVHGLRGLFFAVCSSAKRFPAASENSDPIFGLTVQLDEQVTDLFNHFLVVSVARLRPVQPDSEYFAVGFEFDGLEVNSKCHVPSLTDGACGGSKS